MKLVGHLALVIALILMSLEMRRVRGWFADETEYLISAIGWSAPEFWATVANGSATAAVLMLIIGMTANRLSRSRMLAAAEAAADKLYAKAVLERIRAYEDSDSSARDA